MTAWTRTRGSRARTSAWTPAMKPAPDEADAECVHQLDTSTSASNSSRNDMSSSQRASVVAMLRRATSGPRRPTRRRATALLSQNVSATYERGPPTRNRCWRRQPGTLACTPESAVAHERQQFGFSSALLQRPAADRREFSHRLCTPLSSALAAPSLRARAPLRAGLAPSTRAGRSRSTSCRRSPRARSGAQDLVDGDHALAREEPVRVGQLRLRAGPRSRSGGRRRACRWARAPDRPIRLPPAWKWNVSMTMPTFGAIHLRRRSRSPCRASGRSSRACRGTRTRGRRRRRRPTSSRSTSTASAMAARATRSRPARVPGTTTMLGAPIARAMAAVRRSCSRISARPAASRGVMFSMELMHHGWTPSACMRPPSSSSERSAQIRIQLARPHLERVEARLGGDLEIVGEGRVHDRGAVECELHVASFSTVGPLGDSGIGYGCATARSARICSR